MLPQLKKENFMKIGFRPQKLVQNLVLEKFSDNGNTMKRIIEISEKNAKTVELTYKKAKFVPTQWYVANYNVIKRDGNSTLLKSMTSTKSFPDDVHTIIQKKKKTGRPEELTIDITNGEVNKTVRRINNIERAGV